MSNHRRRIDRATAEQLLSSRSVIARPGDDPLAELLASAAAPPHAEELRGQDAALAAFRSAVAGPTARRAPRIRRILTTRTLTGPVLAALTVSAIALAAGTGIPLHRPDPTPAATVAPVTEGPTTAMSGPRPTPTATPRSPATPSVVALCQAFAASAGGYPGKALDDPTFDMLINKAGGKDKIDGFCSAVLATPTRGHTSVQPGPATPTRDVIGPPPDDAGGGSWGHWGPWGHHGHGPSSTRHHGR